MQPRAATLSRRKTYCGRGQVSVAKSDVRTVHFVDEGVPCHSRFDIEALRHRTMLRSEVSRSPQRELRLQWFLSTPEWMHAVNES